MRRREFLVSTAAATLASAQAKRRPNVVLIMSDDQGYGDLSLHGNDKLKTPHIDSVAKEGVQLTQFQVCPVCSPTRASLMTGRYNYRTGVVDTYMGRSMMYPDEVTVAEILGGAGYRTGIFGKWHLGDNYPLRAMDQGFQECLLHNGGGIGQPSDPPGNTYFDPVLQHNGKPEKYKGYCTDIFFDAAMRFAEKNARSPFLVYIATNAPHTPLQVDESYVAPFRALGLDDTTAKIYGMVVNLDNNVGRMLAKLKSLNLDRDTVFIFLTDNGPQQDRFNAGMRGRKGTAYQGGIRVPCFVRWPGRLEAGRKVDRIAAHIDLLPTLLEACEVRAPNAKFDGKSLMPLLAGSKADWPDRMLHTQWHRGDEPELFRNSAARTQQYKLVNGKELYDISTDPGETRDLAAEQPDVLARMRKEHEAWLRDVSATRGYAPPRIHLGTKNENPVILTRQDWRGPQASWESGGVGHWEVEVAQAASYEVKLRIAPVSGQGEAEFRLGEVSMKRTVAPGATECVFQNVKLPAGKGSLQALVREGSRTTGVHYVDVRLL